MGIFRAATQCALALVISGAAHAAPPTTAPAERTLFLQRYARIADFQLERGEVSVWEPMGYTAYNRPGVLVEFSGAIDKESGDVLSRLLERRTVGYLTLNSPGGLVEPTLRLGKLIRAKSVATIVEGGRVCFSACALLFLAGTERVMGESIPMKSPPKRMRAEVGFHAPYIPQSDGTNRYLQDIKTSRVCGYIKSLMPPSQVEELCATRWPPRG